MTVEQEIEELEKEETEGKEEAEGKEEKQDTPAEVYEKELTEHISREDKKLTEEFEQGVEYDTI